MLNFAALADRIETGLEKQIRPRFLTAVQDWRRSNCQDPLRHPSKDLAPNWGGPHRACPLHGLPCTRCHSCAACRPEQREPGGDWDVWLRMAGRGEGKTRSAAELVAEKMALNRRWRVCVLAPTYADARDTCIEGESGLLAVFERWGWTEGYAARGADYTWNRSLGELIVHTTSSRLKLFSAEKPARLRGPQHHYAWVEELAQVVRDAPDAWDMMKFGLRLGKHPHTVATTTPLPLALIRQLLTDPRAVVSRGTTDSNAANLPPSVLHDLHRKYDGTRLGRQELGGELLDDIPGALWKRWWIDTRRIQLTEVWEDPEIPQGADDPERKRLILRARVKATLDQLGIVLVRVVVAIDPAVTSGEDADETGLIVAGKDANGVLYVLEDGSCRESPAEVMMRVVEMYDAWEANAVVVETNNGGDYIPGMLNAHLLVLDRPVGSIPIEDVKAKKGKRARAEPVSQRYEKPGVRHVGPFDGLEDQQVTWEASKAESPDRIDALVYAILYLDDAPEGTAIVTAQGSIARHNMSHGYRVPVSSVRR